ncbi:peptide chain release factor N(5)-glutamine methyltransferase [Parabacteroides sp. OttesenSCG-928-N08]|nr:peptide chain release factor N(5)-glutamine methyltransferase [Parabacteroides sp. OttesenSCG-928-N08]
MRSILTTIQQSLSPIYPPGEVTAMTRLIMQSVCGIPPYRLLLDKDSEISPTEREKIMAILERLLRHEPIQYILGETEFYGLPFAVTPDVLIPRPETEELVELVVREERGKSATLLDLGTGSGCIAIALKQYLPTMRVVAIDLSDGALQVARQNAERNKVIVDFRRADILSPTSLDEVIDEQPDIIVSNPPYVFESEKQEMSRHVLEYEPAGALFVPDDDPLLYYRAIARFGHRRMSSQGKLYLEINAQCGAAMEEMLYAEGYRSVEIITDIFGKERIIKAQL